jgi:hypothetical protein
MSEIETTTTEEQEALPCFVRHHDAGGLCEEPGTIEVYGLRFCEAHGLEARLGAAMEAHGDAEDFFERFRSPHTLQPSSLVGRALEVAIDYTTAGCPDGEDYDRALALAYPNPPDDVRTRTLEWMLVEEPGYQSVEDYLLEDLMLTNKLLRLAYEDGATWMVERLEVERERLAAEAAVALEESKRRSGDRAPVQPGE